MGKLDWMAWRGTVEETMILPLLSRASCSKKYPGLFRDPGAEKAAAVLAPECGSRLRRMAGACGPLYALRQDLLVWAARRYLRQYPDAVIVNLGCGLDTSFEKADNGRCRWINLDLPEVIRLRGELLSCGEREENLAWNAADLSWTDRLREAGKCFVIGGGVFYYFQPEQVKNLFCGLAAAFPEGGVCFDCQSSRALRQAQKTAKKAGGPARGMHFAVDDAETLFRPWSEKFGKIETISRLPRPYFSRGFLPLGIRMKLRYELESGMLKFVEIRFRKENSPCCFFDYKL